MLHFGNTGFQPVTSKMLVLLWQFKCVLAYKRLNISEVWFWENNQLFIYGLIQGNYQEVSKSILLPDLDIDLLVNSVKMNDILPATTRFLNGIRNNH